MSRRHGLARRIVFFTFTNSAGKVIRLATGFVITPLALHHLGATDYGLWMLIGSLLGYGSLLDFGVASAVVKYVSQYKAEGDLAAARSLIATAVWLYLALGALAVVIGFAIAPFFGEWFQIPADQQSRATVLVYIMAIGVGLAIPRAATTAVLAGVQRFDVLNLLNLVNSLVSAIATAGVLLLGGRLLAVIIANTLVAAAMQIPSVWLVRRAAPELDFGMRGGDLRLLRRIVSFSSSMFIMDISGFLVTRTDEMVIAAFLPVSAVSPFVVARRLGELPQMLTDQFVRVILPVASDFGARGDTERMRLLFFSATRITLAMSLAVACPLAVLAGPALRAWVGQAYESYAYLIVMLVISSTVDIAQWPGSFLLQSLERHRRLAYISAAISAVSVLLSIVFAPKWGLAGVAMGTLIPMVVGSFAFKLPYVLHVLGVGWRQLATSSYSAPILAGIPAVVLCGVLDHILAPTSVVVTAAVALGTVLTYCAGYLWVAAPYQECVLCREVTRSAWERIKPTRLSR